MTFNDHFGVILILYVILLGKIAISGIIPARIPSFHRHLNFLAPSILRSIGNKEISDEGHFANGKIA